MELKNTITVSDNDPIEVKVDIPEKDMCDHTERTDVSMYAKFFDETCMGWTNDAEMNKLFILQRQNFANEKLQAVGHLFLNEVYDMLGISRTSAEQCVGWVYDVHNPVGDNYVDFGIFEDRNRGFVNGMAKNVLLDFNVDGDILKYL